MARTDGVTSPIAQELSKDGPSNLFGDVRALEKDPDEIQKDLEAIAKYKQDKFGDHAFGRIARSSLFEQLTISIILFNAIEIGADADYSARWPKPDNLYQGPIGFIICEVFFCAYFTLEILIRFAGFRRKVFCFGDAWFLFDATLVTTMILETVVFPLLGNSGPLGQLTVLRLLRLLRITRMAKLMRAFPELMVIVRGVSVAIKAVFWTALMMVLVSFATAIVFTNQWHQGSKLDAEVLAEGITIESFFGSLGKSFLSLLVMGTVLDDVTACTMTIRETGNIFMLVVFLLYIMLNSFTMMNMLVGIMVEVVGKTAEAEKKRLLEQAVRDSILTIFLHMDNDKSGRISKEEFLMMKDHPKVMSALQKLDIREKQFDQYLDLLFVAAASDNSEEEFSVTFDELLDAILRLRPGHRIASLDFSSFRTGVYATQRGFWERSVNIERVLLKLRGAIASTQSEPGDDASSPLLAMPVRRCFTEPALLSDDVASLPEAARSQTREAAACVDQACGLVDRGSTGVITEHMLSELAQTTSTELIEELERRLGVKGFGDAGVPLDMMDEELRSQMKVVAKSNFECYALSEPDPEFLNQEPSLE